MHQHLYKYLVLHRRLNVPGLGHFVREPVSASLDVTGTILQPPLPVIRFRQEAVHADKQFYDFLAWEMDIDEVEAIQHFRDYAEDLKKAAAVEPGTTMPGIGKLSITENGQVHFEPTPPPEALFPPVPLPDGITFKHSGEVTAGIKKQAGLTEITAEPETEKNAGSSWWIYAAILLLIGVGIILYYYA